jgi:hypothetical protein
MRARWIVVVVVVGCGSDRISDHDADARRLYPDLPSLYGGDQGIYRGCAPNGGVCHNANEFPDLHTVGSIVDNIGRSCNPKRDRADSVHDLCEQDGDRLVVGGQAIEIAWLEPAMTADPVSPREWHVHLREPATAATALSIARGDVEDELYDLSEATGTVSATDPTVVDIVLPATPANLPPEELEEDLGTYLASVFSSAGLPNDPMSIRLGDSNRNGTYGGELGGMIVKPGDPARSYLMRRLIDPSAGPLMPRANCCFWTKAAVRAMQCWIEGLAPDGSNALAPIDYDRCGPGSDVELLYPTPGPACESSGLCPVEAGSLGGTSFAAIYADVLVPRCSGSGCHNQMPAGGVDFATEHAAYESLKPRVVGGDPSSSLLFQRISPELCTGECKTMPLGRPSLPAEEIERIRAWIESGASRE